MPISQSVKVATQECGLSERTLREAIKRGELEVIRVGRRVLIKPGSLNDYLHGRTRKRAEDSNE